MIGRITPRKLNADTDDRSLSADEMKKAINIAVDSDSDGDGGVVKFSDGNTAILPSDALAGVDNGVNTVIGSVSDEELGVVYFFVHNSLGNHGVYAYSSYTNTYRKIFSSPTLDFDQNGFVKGDIVRIKRQYEMEAPQIIVNQGESGGAVVDTGIGGGGGPVTPIGELTPETININVGRDLYPLIELDEALMDSYGSGITSTITAGSYEAVITGTYNAADAAARSTPVPIVFYNSPILDLNLNPEGASEIVVRSFPDFQFNTTSGQKSIFIEINKDIYVHPDVTTDGTLNITVVLRPIDPSLKIQAFSQDGVLGNNYEAEVSYDSMSETIVFQNVVGSASSVGSSQDRHPVLGTPNKTRTELTVADIYGDTYLTYIGNNSSYLLDIQKKIMSCRVNELSSSVSVSYNVETGIEDMKLVDRTVPVKIRVDYENAPSYIAFKSLWAAQQNANTTTGSDYNPPADAAARSVLRIPDNTTTGVIYYTFCPLSMRWTVVGDHPSSIEYTNADGSFKPYSQLVSEALSFYSSNSESIIPWQGNTSELGSIDAVLSEIQSVYGAQWVTDVDGTFPNWIAVQVFVGGTGSCSIPSATDVFNPVLVVAPVVANGETKYKLPRVVRPYSWPGQYLSGEAAIDALANDASFVFVVDIPVAWHHGSTEGSTEEYDFILVGYNNSNYDAFNGVEDVVFEGYDAHLKFNQMSALAQVAIIDLNSTTDEFNGGDAALQVFSDADRTLSYNYSINGDPSLITTLKGRRLRVSFGAKRTTLYNVLNQTIAYPTLGGSFVNNRFTGLVLTPYRPSNQTSQEFCYGFGTSCANSTQLPPPKNIRIPDAPVITQGDLQEEFGGDTTTDGGGTTTTTTTTTDTTKPTTPESSTLSLPTKDTSTTTKETIKKKY